MKIQTLEEYTKDLLTDNIEGAEDYIELIEYIDNWSDLAFKLLESYNIDGSTTYNSYASIEMLKNNYYDVGEYIEEIKDNWCAEVKPFQEPEKALTQIVLYIASGLNITIDENTTWEDIKEQL